MSFEQLTNRLNEIADLNKALSADAGGAADDKKIADAAADGAAGGDAGAAGDGSTGNQGADAVDNAAGAGGDAGEGSGEGAGEGDGNPEDDEDEDDGEGKGASMAKSFTLTLEDGTEAEAYDGTEMLKSFTDRLETMELFAQSSQGEVMKALNSAADLLGAQAHALKTANATIAAQGAALQQTTDLVKSLQGRVEQLANTGRGRATTVQVNDKPGADGVLAKSLGADAPMGKHEILAKSLAAQVAGRITGLEASGIETRLNMGMAIEPTLLAKISQ